MQGSPLAGLYQLTQGVLEVLSKLRCSCCPQAMSSRMPEYTAAQETRQLSATPPALSCWARELSRSACA